MNNMIDGEHNQLAEDMCETDKRMKTKSIINIWKYQPNKGKLKYFLYQIKSLLIKEIDEK